MKNEFRGKTILVTGGTGSIGSELVRQLLTYNPKQVRVFSRDETRQYELQEKLREYENLRFLIGDIRDYRRLDIALRDVDIVFHAAAMKHVPFSEYNPFEAVQTNIIGSQNVIELSIKNKVQKIVGISTDKAANPKNVLGTSKLMMEKLFTNANFTFGLKLGKGGIGPTRFSCVRFGNIAWARGSVLPLWKKQAETNQRVIVTDATMTRFLISKEQAIRLVLSTTQLMRGGEIFVLKMPAITLGDLAKKFVAKYYPNKKIRVERRVNRGNEKMHEQLLLEDDRGICFENREMIIFVPELTIRGLKQPKFPYKGFTRISPKTYSSEASIDTRAVARII